MSVRNLIFILGDQLTPGISSLNGADKEQDLIFMCEVADETTYVPHHKKKIAYILSAMRHFKQEMNKAGWTVEYVQLDDDGNSGSFTGELTRIVQKLNPEKVILTEAGEWRVKTLFDDWASTNETPLEIRADDRFIASHDEFQSWAKGRKSLRMEFFYREMRKKTGLLMEGDAPAGGQWNYDSENRKPASDDLFMPKRDGFSPTPITRDLIKLVEDRFSDNLGKLDGYWFPVTRADAEAARDHFIRHILADFGDYQDAMLSGQKFLYHSLLSPCINNGLLDPLETCQKVDEAWRNGKVPLNAAEGFIRQIIGWREYVRGIYWLNGPDYVHRNALDATRPLPHYFWDNNTQMSCMKAAIGQTLEEAYAHHIQRLMVTGVFCLLTGIDPHEVHEWYLAVYADAYEWVEAPNVIGMILYADGGQLGSKPYAASGSYINKMSDYCENCVYAVTKKTGRNACPFNSLYWHFLVRHRDRFEKNGRISRAYSTWDRMAKDKRSDYLKTAEDYLEKIETL